MARDKQNWYSRGGIKRRKTRSSKYNLDGDKVTCGIGHRLKSKCIDQMCEHYRVSGEYVFVGLPPAMRSDNIPFHTTCELCLRKITRYDATRHHLTPRMIKPNNNTKTATLCVACHRFVHEAFANQELAKLNSIGKLRANDKIKEWLKRRDVR